MTLYLDNSATTQVLEEVKNEMIPYLNDIFGNPSSKYYEQAERAKQATQNARDQVANLIGATEKEVVFTSGATESNNTIIKGVADYHQNEKGNHIITTKVEHPATLETCKFLEEKGFRVTYLDVDQFGRIDVQQFKDLIENDPPVIVSMIWGNNEVGALNPIKEVSDLCDQHNIFFHTDATQIIGKLNVSLNDYPGINFVSFSSHKVHGPKGIGVAIIREDDIGIPFKLTPLIHGGEQENGYRSGTLAIHNIVGFGKACEIAHRNLDQNIEQLNHLETKLIQILNEQFGDKIAYNNDDKDKIPGLISVLFKGVNNEMLVKKLAPYIAVSTGSACSSGKPSHVLQAMGFTLEGVRSTVRMSMSPYTQTNELDIFKSL